MSCSPASASRISSRHYASADRIGVPDLKDNYALDFAQIGLITLAFQFTASLLQRWSAISPTRRRSRFRWRRHGLDILGSSAAQHPRQLSSS